ncbi:MAG: Ku protein [Peptococcaceae bacterium]|nr:Ku protein [Peptococcaceae bacterium]
MAIAHKSVISFGLVAIPIAMHTAVTETDISFNQLHKEDHARIRYKKTCAHCGKEVKSEDIIKGYQYDTDRYVTVTDEEIERIKTEKEKSIQILHFANLNQISPVYYDKAYYVLPAAGGEKAYELLRQALMSEQKVAIGKTVMGSHENLMVIIPREDGIVILTMFFDDEVKEIPNGYSKQEISDGELQMAKTLINSMDTPFDPTGYHNEYQAKLRQLIEDKIAGKDIVSPADTHQGNIIDLMEALKKSVEQEKGVRKKSPGTRKTG